MSEEIPGTLAVEDQEDASPPGAEDPGQRATPLLIDPQETAGCRTAKLGQDKPGTDAGDVRRGLIGFVTMIFKKFRKTLALYSGKVVNYKGDFD